MTDPVNHPSHYNASPSGVECADVIGHMPGWQSHAMKYLWRAGLKGDEATDLRKSIWWIQFRLKQLESPASPSGQPTAPDDRPPTSTGGSGGS